MIMILCCFPHAYNTHIRPLRKNDSALDINVAVLSNEIEKFKVIEHNSDVFTLNRYPQSLFYLADEEHRGLIDMEALRLVGVTLHGLR